MSNCKVDDQLQALPRHRMVGNDDAPSLDYHEWLLKPTYGYTYLNNVTLACNNTVEDMDERTPMDWARDLGISGILMALSLITVVGNVMVLHAVRTERSLQTVSITLYTKHITCSLIFTLII